MKITAIEQAKKNKDRYNVYLDGEYKLSVSDDTLLKHRELIVGGKICESELEAINIDSEYSSAFSKSLKYISRVMRTEQEVRVKLSNLGFDANASDYAISRLKEYGYINDENYAKCYVGTYNEGRGRIKLRYDMKNKGINEAVISEALSDLDELEMATQTAAKFTKRGTTREKLMRNLANRGFSYDIINEVIGKIEFDCQNSEEETLGNIEFESQNEEEKSI